MGEMQNADANILRHVVTIYKEFVDVNDRYEVRLRTRAINGVQLL